MSSHPTPAAPPAPEQLGVSLQCGSQLPALSTSSAAKSAAVRRLRLADVAHLGDPVVRVWSPDEGGTGRSARGPDDHSLAATRAATRRHNPVPGCMDFHSACMSAHASGQPCNQRSNFVTRRSSRSPLSPGCPQNPVSRPVTGRTEWHDLCSHRRTVPPAPMGVANPAYRPTRTFSSGSNRAYLPVQTHFATRLKLSGLPPCTPQNKMNPVMPGVLRRMSAKIAPTAHGGRPVEQGGRHD